MLNHIQKLHALLLSDKVNVWHFAASKDKPYRYWLASDPPGEGYGFDTLGEMIEAAYAHS